MKKIAFLAAAACAAIAAPAMAQSSATGTITLNGTVANKCSVTSAPAGSTFAQTVNFGELAQANGTLRSGLAGEFTTAAVQATVVCNTGTPKVAVDANPMVNVTTAAPTGYANTINYTASVAVTATGANAGPFTNSTLAAAAPATAVGSALANSANNVVITTNTYATPAATDILVAGSYTGTIVVVISPA